MRRRDPLLLVVATAVGLLSAPAPALAYYGNGLDEDGALMVSADYERLEQGDDTTDSAAIAADGRYVVIKTRARNFFADDDPDPSGQYRAGGVFRFDLETDELEKVADGDLYDEATATFLRLGATNPSVSADGRYVAFATAERLVAADTNDSVDVYVRDMNLGPDQEGAFDLVSALDGGDVPATYGPPPPPYPADLLGSDLTAGVAISADGDTVAFRTTAPSNLPSGGSASTAESQIFVRDRTADSTTLVTRADPGGAPAGGALGAVLSADGTTVAWTGSNAAAQTRFLSGENTESSVYYYLWQRVADGSGAPTRRITGISDPDDPDCPSDQRTLFDETTTGPCYGPLTDPEAARASIISALPALSGDGYEVAFLTGAGPRPNTLTGPGLDLYLTDMSPGLSRKESTVELTRDPLTTNPTSGPAIEGIAMSSGGRYLAMATSRTAFALSALELISDARAVSGTRELYMVDLQERTIDRVARSYNGGDTDGQVENELTLTSDGSRVAFTSFAGNLFFGDANDRADAFVATRQPDPGTGSAAADPNDVAASTIVEVPRLTGVARSRRHGKVTITIEAPAAGDLKASATADVGKPRKRRTLAAGKARAEAAGTVQITLRPVRRYRAELRERKKIKGRAELSFVPAIGGDRQEGTVKVVFRA